MSIFSTYQLTALFYLMLLSVLFSSCSRSIYEYNDIKGSSEFILYSNNNYEYKENSSSQKLKYTGVYELKDSMIVFTYKHKENLPFTYSLNSIEKLNPRENPNYQKISIVDKSTGDPLLFSGITLLNEEGQKIGAYLQKDTEIRLQDNKRIHSLDFHQHGYPRITFDYADYSAYDIKIQVEPLESGGRMKGNCLISYIDVLLKYRVDDPQNITRFQKDGIIYRLKEQ